MRTHLTPLVLAAALAGGAGLVGAQGARIDGTGAGLNAGAAAKVDGSGDRIADPRAVARALAAAPNDPPPVDTRVLGNRGNIVPDGLPGTLGGHVDGTADMTLDGSVPAATVPREPDEALNADVQR